MSIVLGEGELWGDLAELNRSLADQERKLHSFISSQKGLDTLAHIWAALDPDLASAPAREVLQEGASAFVGLLEMTPPVTEELDSLICRPLFPHQRGYTPAVSEDAGLILTLGSLYLGVVGRVEQPDLERLWEVIAGADIVDELLRNAILGRPFEPPPPVIPDYLDVFVRQNCFAGVLQAQLGFALALQAWAPSSNSDGISEIEPGTGCDGDTVVIRGTGFGRSQPQGVEVWFPDRAGGCTPARVLPNGWSPTAIEVEVPSNVGTGCVGFVSYGSGGRDSLAETASRFIGEVGSCLGSLAGERVRSVYERLETDALSTPCPPCLPGDRNRFVGGPPTIEAFFVERARGTDIQASTAIELEPFDIVELHWRVQDATNVEIVPVQVSGQLNELPTLAGPFNPTAGASIVMWSGTARAVATFTWLGGYELRATNGCVGTSSATVTLRMRAGLPQPAVQGFWGVADAGRQVEGNNTNDDWEIFTTDPKILQRLADFKSGAAALGSPLSISPQRAGSALDHWNLTVFIQAVERAQALGLNAYRFSIEWSRVEPTRGTFDPAALANYQAMIDAVRARGMEPFVVLSHLSLPAWVLTPPRERHNTFLLPGASGADPDYLQSLQGWETSDTVDEYVQYAEHVVTELDGVRYWITFNEPLATTILTGYIASVFPPGFLDDGARALVAIENLVTAHARAYESIKVIDSAAQVGITDQWLACKPTHDANATAIFIHYHQDFLIDALVRGQATLQYVDAFTSQVEGLDFRVLGIAETDWKPHLDFFGLQYYKSVYPEHLVPLAINAPWVGAKTDLDLSKVSYSHALLNDMGWEMCPQGLYDSLMKLKQIATFDGHELPILVAENGTAEVIDHNRASYITSHLEQLQRARSDGVNVIGYLHWSLADNWEWIDGYRQEARFGLFSVELPPTSVSLNYSITDGALALAYVMADPDSVLPAAIASYGRYEPDGTRVEHPTTTPFATFAGQLGGTSITLMLAHPDAITTPAPQQVRGFIGLLFYGNTGRWIRLTNVVWDAAHATLQFSHPAFTSSPQVPERIFALALDPAVGRFSGLVSQTVGNSALERGCELSRLPFAGMWQGHPSRTVTSTLALTCPEGTWRGRVLFGADWFLSPLFRWIPTDSWPLNEAALSQVLSSRRPSSSRLGRCQ